MYMYPFKVVFVLFRFFIPPLPFLSPPSFFPLSLLKVKGKEKESQDYFQMIRDYLPPQLRSVVALHIELVCTHCTCMDYLSNVTVTL